MFGTGIKTVEGRLFVSQRQPPLTCVRIISSKRVHHVTTYLIHGVPTRLSVSRVENRYICITQLRSIDLPATRSLLPSSVPLLSCSFFILLLVNFRCLSSSSFVCSSKHFLFVSSFFFFYHLSTFSSFSFLSNYLSLLDRRSIFISPFIFSCTFPAFSSSHPFLQSLYPSFCLSYSSFFVCFRSLSFFCISSSIFYSLFLSKVPRARNRGFSFTFRHLKNFFRFHFLVCISSIFFSNHFLFPFFPYLFILFCSRMFLCLFILFFPVYSIVKIPFII